MWDAGTKTITLRGTISGLVPNPGVTSGIEGWGIIPAWYGDGPAYGGARSGTAPGRLGADIDALAFTVPGLAPSLPGVFHIVSLTTPVNVGGDNYEATLTVDYPARWIGVFRGSIVLGSVIPSELAIFPGELFDVSLSWAADASHIILMRGGVSLSPISFAPYVYPQPATNGVAVTLNGLRLDAESSITSSYGAIAASGLVVAPSTATVFDPERYLYDVEAVGSPPLEIDIFTRGAYALQVFAFDEHGYAYKGVLDHANLTAPYWRANGAINANGELLTATTDVTPGFQQLPLVLRRFDACQTPAADTQVRITDGFNYNEPVGLVRDAGVVRTMQLHRYFGSGDGGGGDGTGAFAFSGWQVSASPNGAASWPLELPNAFDDVSEFRVGTVRHGAPACAFAMPGNAHWIGVTAILWEPGEPWQVVFRVLETSQVMDYDYYGDTLFRTDAPISGTVATLPAIDYEPQRSFQILSGYNYGDSRLLVTDGLRGLWYSYSTGSGWDALPFSPPGATAGMEESDTPYLLPHFCQIGHNAFGVVQVEKNSYPLNVKFWRSWDTMQTWEGPFDVGTLPAGATHPAVGLQTMIATGSARLCAFNGRDSIWISDDYGATWTGA